MMASKAVALAAGVLSIGMNVFAQETYAPDIPKEKKDEKRVLEVGKWYPRVEFALNLTQAAYSDNWNGDETGSLAWNANINGYAERQVSPGLNWLNTLRMVYGQTREEEVDDNGVRSWGDSEESSDQVNFEALFRLTKGWAVDPYASFRWESSFTDRDDPFGRTLWFNPMTFRESTGIAKKFIDLEHHQLLVRAGVGARETYRRVYQAPTGNATGSESAWDSGVELVAQYLKDFGENLTYTSRLSFYQPFNWSKKSVFEDASPDSLAAAGVPTDVADYTTTVDIDWQNTVSAKVTKVIAVQLYVELLYDKYDNTVVPEVDDTAMLENPGPVAASVRKKGQFKETLGIGLAYTFK